MFWFWLSTKNKMMMMMNQNCSEFAVFKLGGGELGTQKI